MVLATQVVKDGKKWTIDFFRGFQIIRSKKIMGDYRKNPKTPFEIRVPNKIRKRIAMHEKDSKLWRFISKCDYIS